MVAFFASLTKPVFGQDTNDALGLTKLMTDTAVARRLLNESAELNKKGQYSEAYALALRSQGIWESTTGGSSKEVAEAYYQRGRNMYRLNRPDSSIIFLKKSLTIQETLHNEDHPDIIKIYGGLGTVYFSISDFENAVRYLALIVGIEERKSFINESALASKLLSLGIAQKNNGELNAAIESFMKSIQLQKRVKDGKADEIANTYEFAGDTYLLMGRMQEADDFINRAFKIKIYLFGDNDLRLANTYEAFGELYNERGDYSKALDFYKKGMQLRSEDAKDIRSTAFSYNNVAICYRLLGNYEKSEWYYRKSIDLLSSHYGDKHPYVLQVIQNLGNVYIDSNNFENAFDLLNSVLNARLESLDSNHIDLASIYTSIGVCNGAMSNPKDALLNYKKAFNIYLRKLGLSNKETARVLINIGNGFANLKMYDEADSIFQLIRKAVYQPLVNTGYLYQTGSIPEHIRALMCQGIIYRDWYAHDLNPAHLHQSQQTFQEADAAIQGQIKTRSEIDQQVAARIYGEAIATNLLLNSLGGHSLYPPEIFVFAESAKALHLRQAIQQAQAVKFAGIDTTLLKLEQDLRIDITWREKQAQALLDKGITETDTNLLRVSSIIFDLKRKYEVLQKRFETDYPDYYRLKYDLSTSSLQYVQDSLLQPKQALLEYFVGDSTIYLFVVRPDTFIIHEVKRDFPLEDWIGQLRLGLYGYYTSGKTNRTDVLYEKALHQYIEYAQKIYHKLFAPVEQWFSDQGSVILVPDGPLGYVPFDALLTSAPRDANNFKTYPYLLHKYQFSYTYSATLLKEMRDKKHHREPAKEFVAFAPFYNGDSTLLATMYDYDSLMRKDLQPLAYSGPEVAAAAALMQGEIVSGQAATEERFTSTAGNYRILHLATHGRADSRVGDYAFLAFTEIRDSLENELLYIKDLYNLELNADLVVLSACETGIGKLQRGEGIISLARAFAYAGAKSIVTTLWSVNDKSTSELMRYFYRELRRGKTKDEALRLARKRYLSESPVRNCHPFFWAAFVALGDMRPVH